MSKDPVGRRRSEKDSWQAYRSPWHRQFAIGVRRQALTESRFRREICGRFSMPGCMSPSGYNMQPWRFIVVQHPEQRRRLRAASYNQAKVEEASAIIVACGDRDGWRRDLEEMLRMGRAAACRRAMRRRLRRMFRTILSSFSQEEMAGWLNKQVTIAYDHDDVDGRGAGLRHGDDGGI